MENEEMNFLCSFYLDCNAKIKYQEEIFLKTMWNQAPLRSINKLRVQKPARMLWYQREDKDILS